MQHQTSRQPRPGFTITELLVSMALIIFITVNLAVGYTFSMFPYPAPQVARHANIQRPVRPIGHYVNPTAGHLLKAALLRVPVRNARRWPGQARP